MHFSSDELTFQTSPLPKCLSRVAVTPNQINFIKSWNLAFRDPPFAANHDAVSPRCTTLNECSEWIMEPAVAQFVQFKQIYRFSIPGAPSAVT